MLYDQMLYDVVVLDTGNGNGKPYSRYVKGEAIPAVLGRYKETKQQGKGIRAAGTQEKDLTVYQVETDEQLWTIGADVYNNRLKPVQIFSRDGKQRYTQPMFKTYAKILLAKAMGSKRPITNSVFLITTTTARDFQSQSIHETLKKFFEDAHKVKVNNETLIIPVQHYEAMSETEAVIYDLLLDENGGYADISVLEQDILIINVGNGTTDLAHFRGLDYINDILTPTIETAYNEVIERLAEIASDKLEREIKPEDIRSQLDLQHNKENKTFNFYGDKIEEFAQIYKQVVDEVFAVLIAEINLAVPDTGRYHRIAVVGGGAEEFVWKKHFEAWNNKKVQIPNKPTIAPARGAYKWGVAEVTALTEEAAAAKE